VPVLGDGGEVPHQPQVQVDRVFQIGHDAIVLPGTSKSI
jgi:hypothetical protein